MITALVPTWLLQEYEQERDMATMNEGVHFYYGEWHLPVWVQVWSSTGTTDNSPVAVPVTCAICGQWKE